MLSDLRPLSSVAEHLHGKEGVLGSIPREGSPTSPYSEFLSFRVLCKIHQMPSLRDAPRRRDVLDVGWKLGVAGLLASCSSSSPRPRPSGPASSAVSSPSPSPTLPAHACIAPSGYPTGVGGLAYVSWSFGQPDLRDIEHQINIENELSPGHEDMYLQLYEADIGPTHQYYGVQGIGRVLWSAFGTFGPDDVKAWPGRPGQVEKPYVHFATPAEAKGEGSNFVSLRGEYGALPKGGYRAR